MSNPAIGLAGLRFCSVIYFGLPNVLLNECTVPLNLIIYCLTLQPPQKNGYASANSCQKITSLAQCRFLYLYQQSEQGWANT